MKSTSAAITLVLGFAALSACNGGPTEGPVLPPTNVACANPGIATLAVGQGVVVDPSATGNCIQIPASGGGTTKHLVVTVASNGSVTQNGVSSTWSVTAGEVPAAAAAAAPIAEPYVGGFGPHTSADQFHARLRQMDHDLSAGLGTRLLAAAPPVNRVITPPTVGSQRNFWVCSSASCSGFVNVTATAAYVGPKVAIYSDNNSPAGGFTQSDIDNVGALFEHPTYGLHLIDTTAFGSESDEDSNGVVIVLLTPRVNRLSTDCSTSVIAGFFLSLDLVSDPHSNNGEVFYSMVPDPQNPNCAISKQFASDLLPVTFIHEFQHMISFNQHALIKGGFSEETWLNEGLSHYAEELGGRLIDNSECVNNNCFGQYTGDNFNDAFTYLNNPEATFLIEPNSSGGTLAERGANWLFVRWFLDQFAVDTVLGTDVTRALETTTDVGFVNVANRSGVDFPTLVTEWQLANYLEGDTTFVQNAATARFRYKTWDLRRIYTINSFPKPYPLTPPLVGTSIVHNGTLRGGSGYHMLVQRLASDTAFNYKISVSSATVAPRIGIVRIK